MTICGLQTTLTEKPLAAPMLDVAALKDVLGKTGIAGADYQNSFVISSVYLRY
jgi:hypothetical protein